MIINRRGKQEFIFLLTVYSWWKAKLLSQIEKFNLDVHYMNIPERFNALTNTWWNHIKQAIDDQKADSKPVSKIFKEAITMITEGMDDEEIETWLILKFGSMHNAYKALDEGMIGIEGKNNHDKFTQQEIDILREFRMRQLIRKMI